MQTILKRYPDFNQVFVKFRLAIVKRGRSMPLDYIMALPKQIMTRLTKQTKQKISEMKKEEIAEAIEKRKKELNKIGKIMEPEDKITIEENLVT